MPRTIYLMAALFLVASSLFALRYGLSRRLDLKRPLASMLPESFGGGKPAEHAKNARRNPKRDLEVPYDSGAATDNQDQNDAGQQDSTESLDTANEPDPESNVTAPSKSGDGKKQADQPDDKMAGDDRESAGDGKSDGNSDDPSGEQGDNKSNQSQNQPDSKQDASSAGESSSLMSKVKDAMQNLLSREAAAEPIQIGRAAERHGPEGKPVQGPAERRQTTVQGRPAAERQSAGRVRRTGKTVKKPRIRTTPREREPAKAIPSKPANSLAAASAVRMATRPSRTPNS